MVPKHQRITGYLVKLWRSSITLIKDMYATVSDECFEYPLEYKDTRLVYPHIRIFVN